MSVRLTITLDTQLHGELLELAMSEERSISWELNKAARLMLHDRRPDGVDRTKRRGRK